MDSQKVQHHNLPQNLQCTSLSVHFCPEKITLISNFSDRVDEEVIYRKNEKENFTDQFFKDFQQILAQLQVPLPRFSLKFEYTNDKSDQFIPEIQKKLKNILESRSCLLPVEKFVMNAYEEDQIMSILPFLDAQYLKGIWILDSEFWLGVNDLINVDKLVKLNQWELANLIVIRRAITPMSVQYFKHFTVAYVAFFWIGLEDLELFQQMFLNSKTLQKFRFEYSNFPERQQFFDSLGTPCQLEGKNETNWFLRISNCDNILHIQHNSQYRNIIFERVELSDVPNGVEIRN